MGRPFPHGLQISSVHRGFLHSPLTRPHPSYRSLLHGWPLLGRPQEGLLPQTAEPGPWACALRKAMTVNVTPRCSEDETTRQQCADLEALGSRTEPARREAAAGSRAWGKESRPEEAWRFLPGQWALSVKCRAEGQDVGVQGASHWPGHHEVALRPWLQKRNTPCQDQPLQSWFWGPRSTL